MIRTPVCDLLDVEVPVALGGLGSGHTTPAMVGAVANAGGIGAIGLGGYTPDQIHAAAADIRALTDKPFALNFLLFMVDEEAFQAGLDEAPPIMAFAWPRRDQDLKPYFERAHRAGCKITFMAGTVDEAVRGVAAGADVIIAQGTEGGGHVGWMTTLTLVPMVVDAIGDVPVLAAGGIADGRGLAAAIVLGAQGALMGTRFLATEESPLHDNFKNAIVDSDGHDTMLTVIPDLASGTVWPGAMSRAHRNKFIERWAGREWEIRARQGEIFAELKKARANGDTENGQLSFGQDAGLIHDIPSAAEVVQRVAAEAEKILSGDRA